MIGLPTTRNTSLKDLGSGFSSNKLKLLKIGGETPKSPRTPPAPNRTLPSDLKSEGSGLYSSLLYDEIYKKLRKSGKTPKEAHRYAYRFCSAFEKRLRFIDDILDAVQVVNTVIDHFDPEVGISANLAVLESYISVEEEFDEKTALLREIDYLEDVLEEAREYGDLTTVDEIEKEIKNLKLRLRRLEAKNRKISRRKKRKVKTSITLPLFKAKLPPLREYQREALDAWLKSKKGIVVLPPGSGKTLIGIYVLRYVDGNALIVVPTIELLKQWLKELRKYYSNVGCFYGENKDVGRITVITYASLLRHQGLLHYFDIVVFDEVHHLPSPKYSKILEKLDGKLVLGLTSTPEREDNRHLSLISKIPVVYRRTFADLKDWLSVIEVIPVKVKLREDESNTLRKIERKIGYVSSLLYGYDEEEEDYREILRVLMNLSTIKRLFLSEVESKIVKAVEIAKEHSKERVIVFTESIKSSEEIAKRLREENVNAQTYHSLHRIPLRSWGRDFNVLVCVRALDEGLDMPSVKVGIMVASSKSLRQLRQRLGRLLRPYQGRKAVLYVLYATLDEWRIVTRLKALAFER